MLKFNNLIWTIFFKTVKPLTDNAGIVIILFSIFFGIGFSFITYLYRKENVRYLGLLDGLYLTSVFYMLRQLPLIHPRIHQALSTVSSIIKASSAYSANFQKAAGITVKKRRISFTIYIIYLQKNYRIGSKCSQNYFIGNYIQLLSIQGISLDTLIKKWYGLQISSILFLLCYCFSLW